MQILIRTDTMVIEDFYHVTIMNESMNWMKLTHLLLLFSLNRRVHFCKSTFTSKFLIPILVVDSREKWYLTLMYTIYANASNNIPSYTHINLFVVWKVHPLESAMKLPLNPHQLFLPCCLKVFSFNKNNSLVYLDIPLTLVLNV